MSNGQPFNLLKSRLVIPVSVSSGGQFVWANEDPKERQALKGLGWFGDGPDGGVPPAWRNPRVSADQWAGMLNQLRTSRALWEWEKVQGENFWYCKLKTHLRRKCDRLLLAQNCILREEDGSEWLETDNWQWFAPARSGTTPVSAAEASVRPWTGPAGDLAGWTGARYGDFAPRAVMCFESGHPRNEAANSLLRNAETFADLPEAWGLGANPAPVYRVDYRQPWEPNGRGGKEYIPESSDTALEWVRSHAPDRIVYWAHDPNAEDDGEVENHRLDAFDADQPLPLWLAGNGIRHGDAFDLMLLVTTWKVSVRVRSGPDARWTLDKEGMLEVRTNPDGYATPWHDYDGSESLDDVFEWRIDTSRGYTECRTHVRQTQAMPPHREGGAQS